MQLLPCFRTKRIWHLVGVLTIIILVICVFVTFFNEKTHHELFVKPNTENVITPVDSSKPCDSITSNEPDSIANVKE